MNKSIYDVNNYLQYNKKRRMYLDDDSEGFIEIGNKRVSQEDSLLISDHPYYDNTKLLLIADGMGGLDKGEVVSNYIAKGMLDWFNNYRFNNDYYELNKSIKYEINNIDDQMRYFFGECGSTIVCALCIKDKTLIVNVGDSRAYIVKDNKLIQVTEDHNLAWDYYKKGIINKDDLRFCINNNLLTSRVGGIKKKLKIDSYILDNYPIDKLFMCSDGVTDYLSDAILEKYLLSHDRLDNKFIDYVMNYKDYCNHTSNILVKESVFGGDDNISAIIKKYKKVLK